MLSQLHENYLNIGEEDLIVIGHRGALHETTENSMGAFQAAIDGGATRLEFDVQLSADSVPVIMHDANTKRTTGHSALVSELSIEELRELKLLNGESIPTLAEVCESYLGKVELNIELKGKTAELASRSVDVVSRFANKEGIIFSCFEPTPLDYLTNSAVQYKRACLVGDFLWPFFSTLAPNVFMDRIRTDIVHPWTGHLSSTFMEQARHRGWTVYPFCSSTHKEGPKFWSRMKDLGIDGLCTNYPRELNAWLKENQ